MSLLTVEMIKKIAPRANPSIIYQLVDEMNKQLPEFGIDNFLRVTHFIAQAAHETDGFKVLKEYASGAAYEGRQDLGNTQRGDGVRYKGRGIFQLTGRYNYDFYGKKLGLDLIKNPELVERPDVAVTTAIAFWNDRKLSEYADNDDIITITRKINGGTNGLQDRKDYFATASKIIPKNIFSSKLSSINNDILAKIGDRGENVRELQQLLYDFGYDINVDGIFGPRTEIIVRDFQQRHGLFSNGVVDIQTMERLRNG